MSLVIQKQHIASLILKERTVGLSEKEQEELNQWRHADPRNESIYTSLHEKDYISDLKTYKQMDPRQGWANYHKRYRRNRHLIKWYWSAAVLFLLLGASALLHLQHEQQTTLPQAVPPGSPKAMLVLNNGGVINLASKEKETITVEGVALKNSGSQLQYVLSDEDKNKLTDQFNELIVPRGGEFTIVLSDGTKIWLNAQTKLKYPIAFNDSVRNVYLDGEAYFEVAKDANRPFHVYAGKQVDIKVLGTSFNVRSYTDETTIETVLEEGAVSMSRGEEAVILSPGHKATYLPDVAIQVETVNTELYTAWKDGQYFFVNESVEKILNQLSRWYAIDIFYTDEAVKSIVFSGEVRRYDDIRILLEAMEMIGGIQFKITGTTLIVSSTK